MHKIYANLQGKLMSTQYYFTDKNQGKFNFLLQVRLGEAPSALRLQSRYF